MKMGEMFTNDIMPGYSFSVIINGGEALQFSKVSNMGAELEYETYCEGGMNTYAHILPKPSSAPGRLSLTRYVHARVSECMVYVGMKMSIPLYISVKNVNQGTAKESTGGSVSLETEVQNGFSFLFTGCLVTAHRFSDLDAQHSTLMEETIDMVYEKMYYLPGLQVSASLTVDF